jgi:hypothetical protein
VIVVFRDLESWFRSSRPMPLEAPMTAMIVDNATRERESRRGISKKVWIEKDSHL